MRTMVYPAVPRSRSCDPGYIAELRDIITGDADFQEILNLLPVYAESDLPILLTGEPGTGKELAAKAICALNHLRQPCRLMNCAALTESLAASELFGHLRGAFTDARSPRPGKFRLADGGTLFLDEVGDLPLSIQSKLLRAVEQGEIEPVGGDEPVQVDVRLMAATNKDLPRLIVQGLFRRDLYDRLAVLEIHLPPLRERQGDIVLLAQHFAQEAARRHGRFLPVRFSQGALRRLQGHRWPGNVRELRNVLSRAVLLNTGGPILEEDIHLNAGFSRIENEGRSSASEGSPARPSRGRLEELLGEEGGNISALARRLRVCTKTVYRWVKAYRIDVDRLRNRAMELIVFLLSVRLMRW
jgi:transcriptional regulator with GAF, ATPase, and Fis domain